MRFQNQGLKTGSFAVTHRHTPMVASMLLIFLCVRLDCVSSASKHSLDYVWSANIVCVFCFGVVLWFVFVFVSVLFFFLLFFPSGVAENALGSVLTIVFHCFSFCFVVFRIWTAIWTM